MISSLLREPIIHIMTIKTADRWVFKMAANCSKWLPAVFLDGFLTLQAPKMAAPWRIFAGQWVIQLIGMHWKPFNGLFYFALWHFRSTAILLEQINVVKRGTTVYLNALEILLYPSPDWYLLTMRSIWCFGSSLRTMASALPKKMSGKSYYHSLSLFGSLQRHFKWWQGCTGS